MKRVWVIVSRDKIKGKVTEQDLWHIMLGWVGRGRKSRVACLDIIYCSIIIYVRGEIK